MFINNRVILSKNGTLTDISAILSDPYAGKQALSIVHAQDALYVGSDMPFNHRFFMLAKKNAIAGRVNVAIWDGSQFTAADDVQDFTGSAGKPFAKSGLIRFALPKNIGWGRVYDTADIEELEDVTCKANYWVKLTFTADLDFELEYVGFRFARDADLNTHYRDLLSDAYKTAFNQGVPMDNWDSVHIVAAEEIIRDLRADEIVWSPNQILDPETFTDSACHKLGEIAFKQLRNEERKIDAQKDYKQSMAKRVFNVDRRGDGRLQSEEKEVYNRLVRQ